MRRLRVPVLVGAALLAALAWWAAGWMKRGPVAPAGGLYFPVRVVFEVPLFAQADPRWGRDPLGSTQGTLAAEGCAVASAAMVLAARGIDVDPGRLNAFLTSLPGGYTPNGWIYWEKAPEYPGANPSDFLPHYEDKPSFFLIDWNLLRGNPVIARLRYPSGITHFVVICGKHGFDYLIADPGRGFGRGIYPLREFGGPVEAIRFYRPGPLRKSETPSAPASANASVQGTAAAQTQPIVRPGRSPRASAISTVM